jgi:hypothetical protein
LNTLSSDEDEDEDEDVDTEVAPEHTDELHPDMVGMILDGAV